MERKPIPYRKANRTDKSSLEDSTSGWLYVFKLWMGSGSTRLG